MRWLLFLALLIGCRHRDKYGFTAGQYEDMHSCIYVYETDQGLRECLVVQHGWAPEDAARAIATAKWAADSLDRRDSAELMRQR